MFEARGQIVACDVLDESVSESVHRCGLQPIPDALTRPVEYGMASAASTALLYGLLPWGPAPLPIPLLF